MHTRALTSGTEAGMGDGSAEIATLSQKLAALAVAETDKDNVFLQERSRHNATKADKDHAFRLFTSRNAETLDDLREQGGNFCAT